MSGTHEDTDDLSALAAEACVYGYPLVSHLETVGAFLDRGFGGIGATPFNHFGHATRLPGPADAFASAGDALVPRVPADVLLSLAQLDLSGGPVRLHVPDTDGAYYVLQFMDAWSNPFAYVGERATGTGEGEWLIVPPDWAGTVPDDVTGVIDAPTAVVSIVGRNACHGPDDVPRVRALQQGFTLTPVGPVRRHHTELPAGDPDVPRPLEFLERMRVWMADYPPAAPDQEYQSRFQPLGLLEEGRSPYAAAEPAFVRALEAGLATGRARVEEAAAESSADGAPLPGNPAPGPERAPGAWRMNPHLRDHGLDHFGVGAIDLDRWKAPDRASAHRLRAVAARVAPWADHGYEAVCAHTSTDAAGEPLGGDRAYTLRFDRPPAVDGSWSIAVYDAAGHRLVENPAGRHTIGDRTPGLVRDRDGGLTLRLSRDRPTDPAQAANWLPTPEGGFRPVAHLRAPHEAVLTGEYELPRIERR
ncbi:DUF1254 domain-containing protein [Streptomyces sp. NPDC002004]